MGASADAYHAGVRRHAGSLGLEVGATGTHLVCDPERVTTGSATSYPGPDLTVIFADPELSDVLAPIEGATAISTDDFIAEAARLGGALVGIGHQRVLDGLLLDPGAVGSGLTRRILARDDAGDRELLAHFIEACGPDDAEEADLDLDELDPVIVVEVDHDGVIAAYGSGRPWDMDDRFDDIGVLVRPDLRGRRLGAMAVSAFVEHQRSHAPDWLPLYRCSQDNAGSNRTAESLGFTMVQRIGAIRFAG